METYTYTEEELTDKVRNALIMFMSKLALDFSGPDAHGPPKPGEFEEIVRKIMKVFTCDKFNLPEF